MAYGVTSEAQLIDIYKIIDGINRYREAVEQFELCGKKVIEASETCGQEALSVNNNSLQMHIETLGLEIKNLKEQLNKLADEFLFEAQVVRQNQYNELIEYQKQQQLQQQSQQQQSQQTQQ